MKKAIIIDHHREGSAKVSKAHSALLALFRLRTEDVISYNAFNRDYEGTVARILGYDYIILSGGDDFKATDAGFAEEIKFLKTTHKPIVGICLGHQLLARVVLSPQDFENALCCFQDGIIRSTSHAYRDPLLRMRYYHKYYLADAITALNTEFHALETSTDDHTGVKFISVMQHRTRSIFSMQGHPEYIDPAFPETAISVLNDIMRHFCKQTGDMGWYEYFNALACRLQGNIEIERRILKGASEFLSYSVSPVFKSDGNYARSDFKAGDYVHHDYLLTEEGVLYAKFGETRLPIKLLKITQEFDGLLYLQRSMGAADKVTYERNIAFYLELGQGYGYRFKSVALTARFAFALTVSGGLVWADRRKNRDDIQFTALKNCSGWKTAVNIFVLDDTLYFIQENLDVCSKKITYSGEYPYNPYSSHPFQRVGAASVFEDPLPAHLPAILQFPESLAIHTDQSVNFSALGVAMIAFGVLSVYVDPLDITSFFFMLAMSLAIYVLADAAMKATERYMYPIATSTARAIGNLGEGLKRHGMFNATIQSGAVQATIEPGAMTATVRGVVEAGAVPVNARAETSLIRGCDIS